MKRSMTKAERWHIKRVAGLGCVLCRHLGLGLSEPEIHHVRVQHGWGRSSHLAVIGLCAFHHRGQPGGIHDFGRDEFTKHYGVSELDLLELVTKQLQAVAA